MKRSGRKSAAQTPAPISERIKGSKRNPKGSAASSESANKINLSDNIIKVLKEKADAYNEKHPKSKVSVSTLKAIFRRGAGAYSSSHRPTITGGRPNSRTAWAYARVNKFLLKKGGTKVKAAYVQDDDLMAKGAILGSSCKTYIANNESVLKTGYYLNLSDFSSMIDPYGQIPLNLNYTLVTYNSGNQDGLSLIDTINPINLQNELAEILNISINNAQVVVGLYIEMGEKLKSISQIESDNIIIIDRDKVVCKSNTNKLYHLGGDMSKHLAPNGKPSNLTHEQWHLVRTPAFKAWFGDWENDPQNASKVVDDNGEPLVVYHGTSVDFTIFLSGKPTIAAYGKGFYFTNDKAFAQNYARGENGKILNLFLNIRKIFEIYDDELPIGYEKYSDMESNKGISRDFTNKLISQGYNGVYAKNKYNENEIVVFEPNQIKLADGSNITFDGNNPDIRYEEGGLTDSLRMAMGNLKKNGIVLKDKNETITLIAYNTGNQERKLSLYNKSLIYKSVQPIKSANEIIQKFDLQEFEMFSEGKIEEYKKSHLIILNQNEVVYDSKNPNIWFDEGGETLSDEEGLYLIIKDVKQENRYKGAYKKIFDIIEDSVSLYNPYGTDYEEIKGSDLHIYITPRPDGHIIEEIKRLKNVEISDSGLSKYHLGGDMSKHLAPNGKPSNLTHEQWHLVRTPAFKAWFGDWENDPQNASKVIDENGEPLVCYHGSKKKFYKFKKKKDVSDKNPNYISGFWFFADPIGDSLSEEDRKYFYDEGNAINMAKNWITNDDGDGVAEVLECFLNVRNPIQTDSYAEFQHYFKDEYIKKAIKNKEKDGWFIHGSRTDGGTYRDDINVFNSSQIKLADGSNTVFDGNNPDIRYEEGGLIAPNGKKSNLTPEQHNLVRTPAFKAWFGDWENDPENASKVVDENGEPLVVWHGTYIDNPFYIFDFEKADLGFHFGTYQQAKNRSKTKLFFKGHKSIVKPFFLNIKTIFETTDVGEWEYPQRYIDMLVSDNLITESDAKKNGFYRIFYKKDNKLVREYLIKKYTNSVGFNYENEYEGKGKSFIVLTPNQIKLADGTNTNLDANNPDIRFEDGGLIAPNGKKSNLTPEQHKLVRTPAFKAWFGDWENDPQNASKVVDENGEPLVVYHGTANVDYFDINKNNESIEFDTKRKSIYKRTNKGEIYFSTNYAVSEQFSRIKILEDEEGTVQEDQQGIVLSFFLNIRNPKYIKGNYKHIWDLTKKQSESIKNSLGDGIIIKTIYDTLWGEEDLEYLSDILIVHSSNQIKLADGRNTTFDAENPDIRYAQGGKLDDGKENFGKPIGFETNLFIHETNNEDAKSIIKDGFKPNKNPVIINGIYTLPKDWKEGYIGRGEVDLNIKLKKGSKIFWTDTDRPIDADLGYGNKFYEELYQKLVKNIAKSPKEAIYINNETWFEAKTKFNREIENWLKENKYCGIQRGGEIVITEPSCIDSITISKDMFEDGGLIAPNGKKSNLAPEQYKLVRTPAFKAWFGDWENDPENASKVIDENGEPLVVYHGSREYFYEFKKDKIGSASPLKDKIGFFFTNNIEEAREYGDVKKYFLALKNPFIDNTNDKYYTSAIYYWDMRKNDYLQKSVNNDGFVIYSSSSNMYVSLEPEQIKLADGSNTTFDGNNPDIRYENGGEMHKNIALPDTYSTFDKLKPILANQGYELNKIGDNNFAEGGLLKPTMSVAQIAKKHGKKESYIEKQLEIGTKHELEHSYSEELAKKTALHHLADMADYYTRLKKMELQQEAEKLTNYYADGGVTDYGTCEVLDEDGERMIDEKSIKQLTECVMNLPQTKSFHIDFETSQYKPYRRRLHKDIIYQIKKDLICVEREEPIAILLGGSPASGKSTFLKKYAPYLLSDEILKIDADEIRAKLPEYRGYNAAQTHLETKDIVTTLLSDRNIGIPCTFDVIYDGTMNNTKSYAPLIQLLKSLGYKVFIIYIDKVPKDVAISRALKRYQNSGRFVPVEVIEDFFTKGKTALNELKSSVDGYMIVDGSDKNYHVIERGGIKIPQDRSYSNIGSPIQITTEDVVREFAKGGQVGMQGSIKHSSGAAGGYLVGKRHSEGGIKAINKSTNQPLEMEGGEVVITRNAVSDSEKREFEGEMLTNREILSRINQSGGGVSFEKGGQTDYKCACNGKKYAYGGKVLSDYEIVNQINGLYPSSSIMTFSEYKDQFNKEASTKDYFNHLQKTGVDTSSITFTERAKLLTY